eukprot:TRINITY_DN14937_c0_g2_i11.p2 TRINITY_DN14937_c0_g2~~TRINITY_DN14937_c0_g2_i11.p2  ORF type:complete len:104 (+),score=45.64 TRINITY_DN14937_c0_g2_i11:799-1110(+)
MSEKELADVKQKTLEIAQREKGPRLSEEAVKKLDSERSAAKSSQSRARCGAGDGSGSVMTHVSYLEKQLEDERNERKKLESELSEIKKMVETLSKSLHGKFVA